MLSTSELVIPSSTEFYWLYCVLLSNTELVVPSSTEVSNAETKYRSEDEEQEEP